MIYNYFTRHVRNGVIYFRNDTEIRSVQSILLFNDDSYGTFQKKEFRWSFDNDNWSSWTKLTQSNIASINANGNSLYLEARYTPLNNDANVDEFSIKYNDGGTISQVITSGSETIDYSDRQTSSDRDTPQDRWYTKVSDSNLLNGKSGDYYLRRYNHIGKQPISSVEGLNDTLVNYFNVSSDLNNISRIHDISIGLIRNNIDLHEASIYLIEEHIDDIDTSLNNLYLGSSTGQVIAWLEDIDASLEYVYSKNKSQDASIVNIKSKNDSQDLYIGDLQDKDNQIDSSLNYLYDENKSQNTSISDLESTVVSQDASIEDLQDKDNQIDSSINSIKNVNNDQTNYINELFDKTSQNDSSIKDIYEQNLEIDASLEDIYNKNDIQDVSITGLRDYIEYIDSSLENYIEESSLGNTFSFESGILDVSTDIIRDAKNIGKGKNIFYEKDASILSFKTIDGSNGLLIFDTSQGLIVDASISVSDPLTVYGDTYSGNLKYHIDSLYDIDRQIREIGDKGHAVIASTGVTQLATFDASIEQQNQFHPWGEVIWDETGNGSVIRYKDWNIFYSDIQNIIPVDVSVDVSSYNDGVYGIYISHDDKDPFIQVVSTLDRLSYADKAYMGLIRVYNNNITNVGTSPDIFGVQRFMRDRNSYADFFESGMSLFVDSSSAIGRTSGSYMTEGAAYYRLDFYNQTFTGSQHITRFDPENPVTFHEGDPSVAINPDYSSYTDLRTNSNLYWDSSSNELQTAPDEKYILISVYITIDNLKVLQRGSRIYDTMDDAESGLASFSLNSMPLPDVFSKNFPRISYFVIKTNVDDLTDNNQFKILKPAGDRIISGISGTSGIVGAENIGGYNKVFAQESNNILQFKTLRSLNNQILLNGSEDTLTIDTSIYDPEPSLNNLYNLHNNQDSSLNDLYKENDIQDVSINDLRHYNSLQDSSLAVYSGKNIDIDASNAISVKDSINLSGDASIDGRLDVSNGYYGLARPLTYIDTDTSVSQRTGTLMLNNNIDVQIPDSEDNGHVLTILSLDSSIKTITTTSNQSIGEFALQRLTREGEAFSIIEISNGYKILFDTRLEFDINAPMVSAQTAEEKLDGTVVSSDDLDFPEEVVPSGTKYVRSAIRFENVSPPINMTITDFILEFVADDTGDGNPVPKLIITAEKTGDSAPLNTSNPYDLTSRPTTDASVEWIIDSSWNTGEKYYSPQLRSIAQEIIDQPDWQAGNSFTVFIDIANDASHNGNARSVVSDEILGYGAGYLTDESLWLNVGNNFEYASYLGNFLNYPVNFMQDYYMVYTLYDRQFIGNYQRYPFINFYWRDASSGNLFELDVSNNSVNIGDDKVNIDLTNNIANFNTPMYINSDLSINKPIQLQTYNNTDVNEGDFWYDGSILYFNNGAEDVNLSENVLRSVFDSSIENIYEHIDASFGDVYNDIDTIDASIIDLFNENDIQDASIINLQSKDSQIDASITDLYENINIVDTSIDDLYTENDIQDASIVNLQNKDSQIDASISDLYDNIDTIEASINDTYDYVNETFLEESSIGEDFRFVDGSLRSNIWEKDSSYNIYPLDSSSRVDSNYISVPYIGESTYTTQYDRNNVLIGAAGIIEGGEITNNGDGTISVTSSRVAIRDTSSNTGKLYFADVASTDITPYNHEQNEIFVTWNNGDPIYDVSTTNIYEKTNNRDQYLHVGEVYREDTDIYISNNRQLVGNFIGKYEERLRETNTASKSYGLELTEEESGGDYNYIRIEEGRFWLGLSEISFSTFDTSQTDFFVYWYQDGEGGWNRITSRTQIDKNRFDDGSGNLADVSSGHLNTHWVFIAGDKSVHVQYGTQNATPEDLDQSIPINVPRFLKENCLLVGRITTKQGDEKFLDITLFNGYSALSNTSSKSMWGKIVGSLKDQTDLINEIYDHVNEASIGTSLYWKDNYLEVSTGYIVTAKNYGEGYGIYFSEAPSGDLNFRSIDATNGNIIVNDSSTLYIDSSIYIPGSLTPGGTPYSGSMQYHFENLYNTDKLIRRKSTHSFAEVASSGITQLSHYNAPDPSQGSFYPWGEIIWDPSGNSSILELNNWNIFFTELQEVVRDSNTLDVSTHNDGIYSLFLEYDESPYSIYTEKVFERISHAGKIYFGLIRVKDGLITNLCVSPDIYGTPKIVRDRNLYGAFNARDLNISYDTSSNFNRGSGSYNSEGITYENIDFYNNTFSGPQNILNFDSQSPMVFYEGDPSVAYDTSIGSYTDFRLYSNRYWDTSLGDFNTAPDGKYLITGIILSSDGIQFTRKGSILYDTLNDAENGIPEFETNSMPITYACETVFPLIGYIIARTDATDLSDSDQVSLISATTSTTGGVSGGGADGILGASNTGNEIEVYQTETNNTLYFRTLKSNDDDLLNIDQRTDTIEFNPKDYDPSIYELYSIKADKTYVDTSLNLKADRNYVDASLDLKVDKSGDTMSGTLNVPDMSIGDVSIDGSIFLNNLHVNTDTYLLSYDLNTGKIYSSGYESDLISQNVYDISTNVSITETTGIYYVDTTYNDVTLTIPNSSQDNDGNNLRIIRNGGDNIVTVTTESGIQYIGNNTEQIITQNDKGFAIVSNYENNKWLIIQDSRFLEGSSDGELQYWDNDLKSWDVTPNLIWDSSNKALFVGSSPNTFYVNTIENTIGVDSSLFIGNPATKSYLINSNGDINVESGHNFRIDGSSLYDIYSTISYVDASLDLKADASYVDAS
ncbi:MAG: hypothetical protein ACOCZ5_00700, partial [bacterium]